MLAASAHGAPAISAVETAPASHLVDAGISAHRIHQEGGDGQDQDEDQCEHVPMVASELDQHQSGCSGYS
jgi:hypothetical protein